METLILIILVWMGFGFIGFLYEYKKYKNNVNYTIFDLLIYVTLGLGAFIYIYQPFTKFMNWILRIINKEKSEEIMNVQIGDYVETKDNHKGIVRYIKEFNKDNKNRSVFVIVEEGHICYCCELDKIKKINNKEYNFEEKS